ncbi:DUF4913 domain-containing protein [Polymorphospora sp. NPDC050346]|uniref:DUF4913 domain-containing protein n=1 Tax=Polymorphospora sp. NPDC050346 TaxID=3155780 RepID=UPI0033E1EA80
MTEPDEDPVANLADLLDQLTGTGTAPEPPATEPDPAGDDPEPVFGSVDEFVDRYLAVVVERRVAERGASGVNWCSIWWGHPEAISRIYALWRAWETLRVSDPQTGMSAWWRDHLDPHLNVLTSENGPFTRCEPGRHRPLDPLPVQPAPAAVLAALPDSK